MPSVPVDRARASSVPPNYLWWQRHGREWPAEMERRRRRHPFHAIEELFLADYVARNTPLRVLEFGCGFGRHLEYLRRIPGADVYGHDQSPSLVAEIARWAEPGWMREHVSLGPPLGPLPYPDASFDLVFTVSVLIHVRPEDLDQVLGELARVSRHQILHLENNQVADTSLSSPEHDGCWMHPLKPAYARLGQAKEPMFANASDGTLLSLPIGEHLDSSDVAEVAEAVKAFYGGGVSDD